MIHAYLIFANAMLRGVHVNVLDVGASLLRLAPAGASLTWNVTLSPLASYAVTVNVVCLPTVALISDGPMTLGGIKAETSNPQYSCNYITYEHVYQINKYNVDANFICI